MKKSLLMLMSAMAIMFTGCSGEKDSDDVKKDVNMSIVVKPEVVAQVEDLSGTVMFNSILGYWYINVTGVGSYDNVTLYFPLNIESEYCRAGQKVYFSGDLYEMVQEIEVPAGTEYYAIKLASIKSSF